MNSAYEMNTLSGSCYRDHTKFLLLPPLIIPTDLLMDTGEKQINGVYRCYVLLRRVSQGRYERHGQHMMSAPTCHPDFTLEESAFYRVMSGQVIDLVVPPGRPIEVPADSTQGYRKRIKDLEKELALSRGRCVQVEVHDHTTRPVGRISLDKLESMSIRFSMTDPLPPKVVQACGINFEVQSQGDPDVLSLIADYKRLIRPGVPLEGAYRIKELEAKLSASRRRNDRLVREAVVIPPAAPPTPRVIPDDDIKALRARYASSAIGTRSFTLSSGRVDIVCYGDPEVMELIKAYEELLDFSK